MATNPKVSNAQRNAEADALARNLDNGYLRIYDGAQPADPDTAITTQVDLADLRFSATSAPATSAGVTTYNAITSDTDINATSTAAWFRAFKSDGTTAVLDGTVGTSSADLIVTTTAFVQHAQADVTSLTITYNK